MVPLKIEKILFSSFHCSMGPLQWEDRIRIFFIFFRRIMTISRQTVTFTFYFVEFCLNPFCKKIPVWKNLVKLFMNSYFLDFKPFLLLLRGLCSKCPFYTKKSFLQEDFFETNLDFSKHPELFFFYFLCKCNYFGGLFENTHWRKGKQMQSLWLCIFSSK